MKKGKLIVAACFAASTAFVACGGDDAPVVDTPAVDSVVAVVDTIVEEVNIAKLKIQDDIVVNASKDKVWEILSKLDNIHEYGGDVTAATITSDEATGVGASRTCTMMDGGLLDEVVTEWTDGASYTLSATPNPSEGNPMAAEWAFSKCLSIIEVVEEGEGTKVSMTMDLETAEEANIPKEMLEGMSEMFTYMQENILTGLKAYIEEGKVMTMEDKQAFQQGWMEKMAAMMPAMPAEGDATTTVEQVIETVTKEETH